MTSTPPPRRRKIAGERRRPGTDSVESAAPAESSSAAPVTLTKGPPTDRARGAEPDLDPTERSPRTKRAPRWLRLPARRTPSTPRTSSSAPGWWGRPATWASLAVALVVMLTLIGLGAFGLLGNTGVSEVQEAEDAQVAAETAPSVAERAAEAILAYDHRSLDSDQAGATKFMTSDFAEEYSATFERTVKSAARTYQAQVTAAVRGSSVIRAGADQVKVLLFVDQTTRSTAHRRPQQALNRVEFVMVEQDGEWLVDGISSY